jgi:hypothetical protein
MANNFIIDAFNFRYKALLKQEQEIVQGYEDGVLSESHLNDFRLEIRFLESELGIKEKMKFRELDGNNLVYLSDDEEYDYTDLPVLKTIEQKSMAELKSTKNLIRSNQNGINDNFKNLITEPIDINYSWGKYGKFNIIIRNKDCFINGKFLIDEAIKFENKIRENLKKEPVGIKKIAKWLLNLETISLMETAKSKLGIENLFEELKLNRYAKNRFLDGMYIHPILVNSLATWVSPSYALEINEIINNMNIDAKLKEEQDRMNEILGIKNDIIEQMQRNYNEISKDNKMLVVNQKVVLEKLDNTVNLLIDTAGRLNNAVGFVEEKKSDIRPTTKPRNFHHLYIYKIYDKKTLEFRTYSCYRLQPKNLYTELKKIHHTLDSVCIFNEPSVNPIQAWIKFKDENKNNINANGKDFTLKGNYTENQLKIDIKKLLNEYKDISF